MMDLEAIVKHKKYIELTAEELEFIKDVASNEVEYDTLRSFLLSTEAAYQDNKIEAGAGLRTKVMEELYAPTSSRPSWLSSFFSFAFPDNMPFYRYPAVQLAMVAVVIFGVFTLFKNPVEQNELAVVDEQTKIEETVKPKHEIEAEPKVVPVEKKAIPIESLNEGKREAEAAPQALDIPVPVEEELLVNEVEMAEEVEDVSYGQVDDIVLDADYTDLDFESSGLGKGDKALYNYDSGSQLTSLKPDSGVVLTIQQPVLNYTSTDANASTPLKDLPVVEITEAENAVNIAKVEEAKNVQVEADELNKERLTSVGEVRTTSKKYKSKSPAGRRDKYFDEKAAVDQSTKMTIQETGELLELFFEVK